MRAIVTVIVVALIALVFVAVSSFANLWLAMAVSLVLATLFITNAIQDIPHDPPHNAVLTLLGRRQSVQLNEGKVWLPFYPFIFGFVPVNMEKRVSSFGPQQVRTPDNALISTSEVVTWRPGIKGKPGSLKTFLDSGGDDGVNKILEGRADDRVKTWGSSNQEGPATWKEAQALRDDAHAVLARALLGVPPLTKVPSPIPTCVWLRFFNKPQSPPVLYDVRPENGWAHIDEYGRWNWDELQKKLNQCSPEARKALEDAVEKRREEINALRGAKGEFPDESLGITILGFTVGEVREMGPVADAAGLQEKERLEQEADETEIGNFAARAKALQEALPGLSDTDALEAVQVILEKTPKRVIVVKGAQTGLGQDLIGAIGVHQSGGNQNPPANGSQGQGDKKKKGPRRYTANDIKKMQARGMSPDKIAAKLMANPDDDDDDDDDDDNET